MLIEYNHIADISRDISRETNKKHLSFAKRKPLPQLVNLYVFIFYLITMKIWPASINFMRQMPNSTIFDIGKTPGY